jgi:L-serine dehydratase
VDECIDAMNDIGHAMPASLRETAMGGLAATPTGIKLRKKVFGK